MAFTTIDARSSDLDERFGFEKSGSFHCPYSAEKFFIVLLAVIAVSGLVGITWVLMASFPPEAEVMIFLAMALLLGYAIWGVLCFVALRLLLKGSEYTYKADESKLTIFHNPQTMDFFYMNIIHVRYEPLMFLRWQRGFLVTVVTRKGTHTFKYIYDNLHAHMAPENTPFYILEDRAELRKETDPDLYFRHKREHQTPKEELIESGRLERPIRCDERLHAAEKIKTVESEDEFIIARGTFSSPHPLDKIMLILAIIICIAAIAAAISMIQRWLRADFEGVFIFLGVLVFALVMVGLYRVTNYQRSTYEADGKEFRITDHKGHKETIYYNDVTEVKYSPLKIFGIQRGYKVDIITKYRTISYKYLFLKNRKFQKTGETPFKIIEDHIIK